MKLNKKQIGFLIATILIGMSIGMIISYAASPSTTMWISGGIYPGSSSYTIWKEGTNYFTKNGNGQLVYSGTNANQIISDTITDAYNAGGGEVFLKAGIYIIDSPIIMQTNVILNGEGESSILYLADNSDCDVVVANNTMLTCIKNIHIKGNWLNQNPTPPLGLGSAAGITFFNTSYSTIDNCHIQDCYVYGIILYNGLQNLVVDCMIDNIGYDGILIINNHGTRIIATSVYYFGIVGVSGDGISLYWQNTGCVISGCFVSNATHGNNFAISGIATEIGNSGNSIIGCTSKFAAFSGFAISYAETQTTVEKSVISGCTDFNSIFAGIWILNTTRISVTACFMEANTWSYYIANSSYVSLGNCIASNSGIGFGMYSSNYTTIIGCHAINNGDGIREYNNANYNIILSSIAQSNTGNQILTLGANTTTSLCWNGTTWIS